MRKLITIAFCFTLFQVNTGCQDKTEPPVASIPPPEGLPGYELDLTDLAADSFRVKLYVEELTEQNTVFQFAATIPGTYQVLNFGQYVGGFKAYTKEGMRIPVTRPSTNQWIIRDPEETKLITYSVKKTYEAAAAYGSNIFKDCIFFTIPSVFGFIQGREKGEIKLKLTAPSNWKLATTLTKTNGDRYTAADFKSFADQPIFAGLLEENTITVGDTQFDIYSFSETGKLETKQLVEDVNKAMIDVVRFVKTMPLKKYQFYFYYASYGADALEHAQSSMHVNSENPYTSYTKTRAAHEFFHVITPFNIHSDVIENFNFSTPTASQHLWLYEGVTVWAANMMQYRNKSISLDDLLKEFSSRAYTSVDPTSLTEISLGVYKDQSSSLAYSKGVILAALLDIKLLSLSNGAFGLRELILQLKDNHGLHKPFAEDELFNEIVRLTYPEIEDFINQYIKGTSPLPLKELFNKIGIDKKEAGFELIVMPSPTEDQKFLFDRWSKNLD